MGGVYDKCYPDKPVKPVNMARAFWGKYLSYSFVGKGALTHKIWALFSGT